MIGLIIGFAFIMVLTLMVIGLFNPSASLSWMPSKYQTRFLSFVFYLSLLMFCIAATVFFLPDGLFFTVYFSISGVMLLFCFKKITDGQQRTVEDKKRAFEKQDKAQPVKKEKRVPQKNRSITPATPQISPDPERPFIHWVLSSSGSGEMYEVDTKKLRCSCPDWSKRRSRFTKGEPQRLCKHLIQVIPYSELEAKYGDPHGKFEYCKDLNRGYPLDYSS